MRDYLNTHHSGSFDPQEVDILSKTFDEIWQTVLADASVRLTPANAQQTREALLQYVADLAMDGDISPQRLKAAGRWRFANLREAIPLQKRELETTGIRTNEL
jgi:hypothetical protein